MSQVNERLAHEQSLTEAKRKERERLAQLFEAVFTTDDGQKALAHLQARFDLTGRVFLPDSRGEVNALRGGIRDGERAVVRYILDLVHLAKHTA